MMDWNHYREALLARVGDLAKLSPDTVRGLQTLDGAGTRTGHLEPRIHELIALALNAGAAVVYSARVLDAYAALDHP